MASIFSSNWLKLHQIFIQKEKKISYIFEWFFEYFLVKVSLILSRLQLNQINMYQISRFWNSSICWLEKIWTFEEIGMFMVRRRRLQKYIFCFQFLMCSATLGEKCEKPNSSYMTLKQSLYTCRCEPYNEDYISMKPSYMKFTVSMKLYFQRYV